MQLTPAGRAFFTRMARAARLVGGGHLAVVRARPREGHTASRPTVGSDGGPRPARSRSDPQPGTRGARDRARRAPGRSLRGRLRAGRGCICDRPEPSRKAALVRPQCTPVPRVTGLPRYHLTAVEVIDFPGEFDLWPQACQTKNRPHGHPSRADREGDNKRAMDSYRTASARANAPFRGRP
jgi:hypothetical protein